MKMVIKPAPFVQITSEQCRPLLVSGGIMEEDGRTPLTE